MTGSHFVLATAGHVDHGKSALIKALTGTDPDRLPEEKSRGITIDLGFAHLDLPAPAGETTVCRVGIIDVPGHEDFVKNMVAGVGSIDLALLVVAADDGWMPQTEEHLQILTYSGMRRAVVALTKIDLASDEPRAVTALRQHLRNSVFAEAPIVPTSVTSGRGLDDVKTTIAGVLSSTPPPRDTGKPRRSVDRVFTLTGTGTVVTGTLSGGVLRRSQLVVIHPSGKALRQALSAKPLDPPSRKEVTSAPVSHQALRFLIETGEVVEISTDLVMLARSVGQAAQLVRLFITEHGPATVSELRQTLRSSRRVVVPLLEHLDRTFVTLRQGDRRTLRR